MRVIMEAILEAHQNVDNYGGTWYVCSDGFFSVVKESYFIHDDGTRKEKPFVSLYNTDDMFYGNHGLGHKMKYIDGEVTGDSTIDDDVYEDYEQPYGEKFKKLKEQAVLVMGDSGIGRTTMAHIEAMMLISDIKTLKTMKVDGMRVAVNDINELMSIRPDSGTYMITNPHRDDYDLPFIDGKVYDMATGKMVEEKVGYGSLSEDKRKALKKGRKKRPKKAKRKK